LPKNAPPPQNDNTPGPVIAGTVAAPAPVVARAARKLCARQVTDG